jgi:hypothetical protein
VICTALTSVFEVNHFPRDELSKALFPATGCKKVFRFNPVLSADHPARSSSMSKWEPDLAASDEIEKPELVNPGQVNLFRVSKNKAVNLFVTNEPCIAALKSGSVRTALLGY